MKTVLPNEIKTVEQAKAFLTDLHNNGEAYHPEDDAHEIVWNTEERPTTNDMNMLNFLMDEIYKLPDFDPCEFLLDLSNSGSNGIYSF